MFQVVSSPPGREAEVHRKPKGAVYPGGIYALSAAVLRGWVVIPKRELAANGLLGATFGHVAC